MVSCPACGKENPSGFHFCGFCAAALTAPAVSVVQERKVVSILFCDLVGLTAASERADPEDVRARTQGYARYAKEHGFATTPGGGRSRRASTAEGSRTSASVPRELEPILDAIRKDRTSLNANIDALIRWAQSQEAKVATAVDDAREAALRQIREAAASLRQSDRSLRLFAAAALVLLNRFLDGIVRIAAFPSEVREARTRRATSEMRARSENIEAENELQERLAQVGDPPRLESNQWKRRQRVEQTGLAITYVGQLSEEDVPPRD